MGNEFVKTFYLDKAKPTTPNQVWVSDITYMPLKVGKWAYLSAWQERSAAAVIHA
jgi:hypothetical protein